MGVAIAKTPMGPYVRSEHNPVIQGNHEVLLWPKGSGVEAAIGTTGPDEIINSILYSEDGLNFSKTNTIIDGPWAGGAFRPDHFSDSGKAQRPTWGVAMGRAPRASKNAPINLPHIQRYEINWPAAQ